MGSYRDRDRTVKAGREELGRVGYQYLEYLILEIIKRQN